MLCTLRSPRFLATAILAPAVLVLLATHAHAQAYPAKPVRVLVGFPPGSGVDITTRLFMPRLAEALGQQIVVDNRPGAAGNIGAEVAARAAPDGYTLLMAAASIAISQTLYRKLSYNLEKDFEPVALVASAPFVLVVHPSLPTRNVKGLVALAKAKPGELTYASTGNGSTPHLTTEIFKLQAGINLIHVPYKGTPPAITDLIAGQVTMMFANTLSVLPHVNTGRLRALAISSGRRSAAAPELPTVAESGMPGFDTSTWFGMLAPAGTSKDVVARLSSELRKIAQLPDVRKQLVSQGADAVSTTPEQFGAHLRAEIAKWGKAVKASGARVD